MTKYVVGFLFNDKMTEVALINKNRPSWQKGLLNGIGGKIERLTYMDCFESARDAMIREFRKETRCDFKHWYEFCAIDGKTMMARNLAWNFFYGLGDLSLLKTVTDEKIEIIAVDKLSSRSKVENLSWLIPLAIDYCAGIHPPTSVYVTY